MKRFCIRLACLACLSATPIYAEQSPGEMGQSALNALDAATLQLNEADGARDRVRALTATIHAFEDGLSAMRDGLRQAAIRERALTTKLAGQESEIATLMGALLSFSRTDNPTALLHPAGALGTARAGMVLAELGHALNTQADLLRRDLEEVQNLRTLQQSASERMAEGLTQIQRARTALNQAMAERDPLPKRFTEDSARVALLISSSETLAGFASGLSDLTPSSSDAPTLLPAAQIGALPLPVQGVLLRSAGEADAAGVARPGVLLATRPQALVTSPFAATIRFVGALPNFGSVVILEPRNDSLVILSGLAGTFGEAGQVIEADTPIGIMGAAVPNGDTFTSTQGEATGTDLSETLYIEVRDNNRPVDPATWFVIGPDN